ncbi:hypothetical protein pEaSNUABM37_00061 [Erwinia phage pEa_SNUABM_37]|nr:hypothetical protein pEaSNUABM37_00061 [Erwinia phage pEa_SNUABM_37]QXO10531.1 hypothetical protein pEaSNUABM48_00061 [Erwinia phage pEa_SNUABM_48]
MTPPLVLYRCGWQAAQNPVYYAIHHPPSPGLLSYWLTGQGDSYDTYVGIVACPAGSDPMEVVRRDFLNVVDRNMTTRYTYGDAMSDRFPMATLDWADQRLAYFAATGQIWDKPIVGHYQIAPDDTWWCTTNVEFFDL